jgi:ankyrin repeat protein
MLIARDMNASDKYFRAARDGEVSKVISLIQKGDVDINTTDMSGNTVLHYSASNGHEKVVEALLKQNANHRLVNLGKGSVMHYAADLPYDPWSDISSQNAAKYRVIKLLLDAGANVIGRDSEGGTVLHSAARLGDRTILNYLFGQSQLKMYRTAKDGKGQTVLHKAICSGSVEAVTILASWKDLLEREDKWDRKPLDLAAQKGEVEVVKILIRSGASNDSAILWAAEEGKIDVVRLLLEEGANPQEKNNAIFTPLHLAAGKGHLEVIKMLLEKGVDVNAVDFRDETSLHKAARNGHLEAVKMLIMEKADYRTVDSDGKSVLHKAASQPLDHSRSHEELCQAKLEMIKIFVNYGVPVTLQSNLGYTALYYGAMLGSVEIVKYLMEHGNFMSLTDLDGRNALLSAIDNQLRKEVIIALLDAGFPIESQTHYGRTAIHDAISRYKLAEGDDKQKRAKAIIELLINRGANLITVHKGGVAALEEIEEKERWPFIILFCVKIKTDAEQLKWPENIERELKMKI